MWKMTGNRDRSVYAALMQLIPQMSAKLHFSSPVSYIYRANKKKKTSFKIQESLIRIGR